MISTGVCLRKPICRESSPFPSLRLPSADSPVDVQPSSSVGLPSSQSWMSEPSKEFLVLAMVDMMPTYFSPDVVRRVHANTGPDCSAPFCRRQVTFGEGVLTGELAHIYGHGQGSARSELMPEGYDPHCYDNAILLCRVCHKMIDRCPGLYPPELIFAWKRDAELAFSVRGQMQQNFIPKSYDLRAEFPVAYEFLNLLNPLRELMQYMFFYHGVNSSNGSRVNVGTEVVQCIRRAANAHNQFKNNAPVFFFHDVQLRSWMAEIIRTSMIVKESPEFTYVTDFCNVVDFLFSWKSLENEEAEPIFSYPTAKGLYELKTLVDRFERHLTDLQHYGMPQRGY